MAQCDRCGHLDYVYHSCRNRSCPKCYYHHTVKWLQKREAELLPTAYFHLVFTVPKDLRELIHTHQKKLYAVLIQSAAESLMELAADPKYIGGKIGVLCVLHTWTRALIYHPHVHCLVPGGGLGADNGTWPEARHNFLVPVKALSKLFRAKFMAQARKALPQVSLPKTVWEKKWVVFCKPSLQGVQKVLEYLGRYVHRIAITNSRILSMAERRVTFRYQDPRQGRWRTMTLEALEFMRRFLQHVLPASFHKVRYYGLLSPPSNSQPQNPKRCPCCEIGIMQFAFWIPPQWMPHPGRPPP